MSRIFYRVFRDIKYRFCSFCLFRDIKYPRLLKVRFLATFNIRDFSTRDFFISYEKIIATYDFSGNIGQNR